MKNDTTRSTLPCICGLHPTIDYYPGVMLWKPGCPNTACPVHVHDFPLFSNEDGAVAAWNMHMRQAKRLFCHKRHGEL